MKSIIIYGSQYGTTKNYAEKLSELTGIEAYCFDKIRDIEAYDVVIHFGGLYAGGVIGLKHTVKLLPSSAKLIIVTVGLADVQDKENTEHIKHSIKKQIPTEIYENAEIFHLRGGIDYDKLNFKHRIMMRFLYHSIKRKPAEEINTDDRFFLETYNKQVDFTDFDALESIAETIEDNMKTYCGMKDGTWN